MSARSDFLQDESKKIGETLHLIRSLLEQPCLAKHEAVALGTYLQNVYSGLERLLRSVLEGRGIPLGKDAAWHKELLLQSRREGLLTDRQFASLSELLAFRHMHIHGYGYMLKEDRLKQLAAPVPDLITELLAQVAGDFAKRNE